MEHEKILAMPFNKDYSNALSKEKSIQPIPRVIFDRQLEKYEFVNAVLNALEPSRNGLIYIATINLEDSDREAAKHIAWLRAKAFSLQKEPNDDEIKGALGEWAVLRYVGVDSAISSVSLVSLAPESKPDFTITSQTHGVVSFDIKTTSSTNDPGFRYVPKREQVKGDPHILGLRLSDHWQSAKFADIFLLHAANLINLQEYLAYTKGVHELECVKSLNGQLR